MISFLFFFLSLPYHAVGNFTGDCFLGELSKTGTAPGRKEEQKRKRKKDLALQYIYIKVYIIPVSGREYFIN